MTGLLDSYRGDGPLRDVTVVDFSQMMMGPLATQLMGDLGALVIKVERPEVGEWERSYLPRGRRHAGESPYFLAMNRNKLSYTADLKSPDDLADIGRLIERADVVVHNYRPGVMERLGLGYDEVRELNPAVVYAQGSGFGPTGPLVKRPGQDLLVQALSGLAANSGANAGAPMPLAAPVCDASAGFLLAFNVCAALVDARATGQGRKVDVSLLGAALQMQCQEAFVAMNTDLRFERSETNLAAPWTDAPYGIYPTADGWLAIAMTPRDRLVSVFGAPAEWVELSDDEFFLQRDEINAWLEQHTRSETTATWAERLAEADIWAAPVLSLEEVLAHEQVEANGFVESIPMPDGSTAPAVAMPATVSGMGGAARLAPPRVGEHTDLVRDALGAEATR